MHFTIIKGPTNSFPILYFSQEVFACNVLRDLSSVPGVSSRTNFLPTSEMKNYRMQNLQDTLLKGIERNENGNIFITAEMNK